MNYRSLLPLSLIALLASPASFSYESTYQHIAWQQRGNDSQYCLDLTDENWQVYPGFAPLLCGDNLHDFSPQAYVNEVTQGQDLPDGFVFKWRIWSASGYGGEGFEGKVVVGQTGCQGLPYQSSIDGVQWGCRAQDQYYCIDVADSQGNSIAAPAACGEGLHEFKPSSLNLAAGSYQWQVWSPSLQAVTESDMSGTFYIAGEVVTVDPVVHGEALFEAHCMACHGRNISLAQNANEIQRAIDSNQGGMSLLTFLTPQDLQDLQSYALPLVLAESNQ